MSARLSAPPLDRGASLPHGDDPHAASARSRPLSLKDEIAVLEEVVAMLDTLTAAGQRHTMSKIARFVEGQMAGVANRLGEGAARELASSAAALGRAGEVALPDVGTFTQQARAAFAILGSSARSPAAEDGDLTQPAADWLFASVRT